jgi:hypothetical protein
MQFKVLYSAVLCTVLYVAIILIRRTQGTWTPRPLQYPPLGFGLGDLKPHTHTHTEHRAMAQTYYNNAIVVVPVPCVFYDTYFYITISAIYSRPEN